MFKIFTLLVIFLSSFLCCGCWDAKEINKFTFPFAIGIDNAKNNNNIHIYSISQPEFGPQGTKRQLHIIESKSMSSAIALLQRQTSKEIRMGQLSVLVFGEEVARQGLKQHLAYFSSSPQIRGNVLLFISTGKSAKDLIYKEAPGELGVGLYLKSIMNAIPSYNFIGDKTFDDFLVETSNMSHSSVIPTISISGKQIYLKGLSVIKGDKMVGNLGKEESEYLSILRNENSTGVISIGNSPQITSALVKARTRITPHYKNGNFSFLVQVDMEGSLEESPSNTQSLLEPKNISRMEKNLSKETKKNLERIVKKLQRDFRTDAISLGQSAYIKYPKQFSPSKWERQFPRAKIIINAKVKLRKIGTLT